MRPIIRPSFAGWHWLSQQQYPGHLWLLQWGPKAPKGPRLRQMGPSLGRQEEGAGADGGWGIAGGLGSQGDVAAASDCGLPSLSPGLDPCTPNLGPALHCGPAVLEMSHWLGAPQKPSTVHTCATQTHTFWKPLWGCSLL